MNYLHIQMAVLFISALIALAGLLVLLFSPEEQEPGENVLDAEYRPAEVPASPPDDKSWYWGQDGVPGETFKEELPSEVMRALRRNAEELKKVQKWRYDERDNLTGLVQMPPPDYGLIEIPVEKLLLFRTKSRKGNPEGRSILRNAYRDWYFKRRIQEIEGIGIERDLAGFPVLTAPEGLDIWDSEDSEMVSIRQRAEYIVQNIRRDSMEGLVKPFGWTMELLSTGGRRQFDTNAVIERYDSRIAMTVLADFVLLGHQQVGSFALSSDKTKLFGTAIGAYLDIICEVFNNQAIPRLIDLNGDHFKGITDYPEMTHGDVESPNLANLGTFLREVTGAGILVPDEGVEDYVRQAAGLPERLEDYGTQLNQNNRERQRQPQGQQGRTAAGQEEDQDGELPDDDEAAVEAAKRRLGRDE